MERLAYAVAGKHTASASACPCRASSFLDTRLLSSGSIAINRVRRHFQQFWVFLPVMLQEVPSSLCPHPVMTLFKPPKFALILLHLFPGSCSRHSKGAGPAPLALATPRLFDHAFNTASAPSDANHLLRQVNRETVPPSTPPAAHLPPARPAAATMLTPALSCTAGGARSAPQPAALVQSCCNRAASVAALQSRLDQWRSRRGPAPLQDGQHADPNALGKPLHSAGAECGCHWVSAGELGGFGTHRLPSSLGWAPCNRRCVYTHAVEEPLHGDAVGWE